MVKRGAAVLGAVLLISARGAPRPLPPHRAEDARWGPRLAAARFADARLPRPHALPVSWEVDGAFQASVEVLKSIAALPPHIAGRFDELSACQRSVDGDYLVFDRRSHMVFKVASSFEGQPKEVVGVGVEPGRILNPSSFDVGPDRTFVIADAPYGTPRVQVFFETGARIGGFTLPRTRGPFVTLEQIVVNGVGAVEFTGQSVLVSQPDAGSLITEYTLDGKLIRAFGHLRRTGQESDPDVHLALNVGRIVANPQGGYYYVFIAGDPVFQKYNESGKLVFERHIEGQELDEFIRTAPTTWRRRTASNEIPLVRAAVRTAAADAAGNLWVSLSVPYTYVYDSTGQKRRTVQLLGARPILPIALTFDRTGHLLVTPGCYVFKP